MHKPETWISIEIQLWLHYLVNPSPDLNAEDPTKRETLLYTPISLQIRQVPSPIPNPPKIQDHYFLKTRAPIRSSGFSEKSSELGATLPS